MKSRLYYLHYHSKYNPIERRWTALEKYWNGAILDSIEIAVEWAKNMTWYGFEDFHCISRRNAMILEK